MSNNIEGKIVVIRGASSRPDKATAHAQLVADHITRIMKETRR